MLHTDFDGYFTIIVSLYHLSFVNQIRNIFKFKLTFMIFDLNVGLFISNSVNTLKFEGKIH